MNRPKVPHAELAVLKVLWSSGGTTVREIAQTLYPGGSTSEYATVQKLLERLRTRRCVTRQREGRAHVWSATVERQDLIRDSLREAAEKLCEGSLAPLLTELVHARDLKPDEIRELRRMIDRLEETGGE